MRIAIEAAKFTPDEANQLRRAMATFRHMGTIHTFEEKMVKNLMNRGYPEEFAKNCFNQIRGFGEYGFPESHAASFARLVYVSSWLKHYHPEVFACGLLNSQPMGFYAPAQIVRDARENGVEVLPVDVSFSHSDNTLEPPTSEYAQHLALRLGFRQVDGFRRQPDDPDEIEADDWTQRIANARARKPFTSLEDFARDTALPKRALSVLADADAFRSLGLDRRAALWAVRRLPDDVPLPLFLSATAREQPDEMAQPLPAMPLSEHVIADYQTIRLSVKGHPVQFLRSLFAREGIRSCRDATGLKDGQFTRCAGVVLVRQQPSTAKGTVFLTIEDETGVANIVVWPKMMARFRKEVMGSRLILIEGTVQKSEEGVVHLVAQRLLDRTYDLNRLSDGSLEPQPSEADQPATIEDARRHQERQQMARPRHPRNVRILPRSRDFH